MAKKKQNTSKFIVYFLAFIMVSSILVSSIFGIIFSGYNQTGTTLSYNGYKFSRENNIWVTNVDGKSISFDYFPEEVDYINISSEIIDMIKNSAQIDFTYDTDSEFKDTIALIQYNIEQTLDEQFEVYMRKGFTTENEFGFPVIECNEESSSVPALYFVYSNQTDVSLKGNCIVAEADSEFDLVRVKDRIIYSLLGIIE